MGARFFGRCSFFRLLINLFACFRFGACFDAPRTAPKRLLAASGPPVGRVFGDPGSVFSGKFLHVVRVSIALAGGAAPPGPPALPEIYKNL